MEPEKSIMSEIYHTNFNVFVEEKEQTYDHLITNHE